SRAEKSVGNSCRCHGTLKSAIIQSGVKPPHSKARFAREGLQRFRRLICDSLLIKSVAIAFLHEDECGSRSNLRARKAMAAFLDCRRAELGDPNHVQPD